MNMWQMAVNQAGTISSVKANGELGRRTRDMGLVPGTEIKIQGRAPLNDPVSLLAFGLSVAVFRIGSLLVN